MAVKSIHLKISSFNLKGKKIPSRGKNSSLYNLLPTSSDKRAYLVTIREKFTVQILCIGTDRSQQTVQTKIRLLLKKQSDQGLHCLPFHQHLLDA